MLELDSAIPLVRNCVAAILRLHIIRPEVMKKGKSKPAKIGASVVGSAFCVAAERYLITAHHILNGGKPRNPADKFYAFLVPDNGVRAFHFPVVGFPVERADLDLAVLEVGPCATAGIRMAAIPVSLKQQVDGARVVTVGYPAPTIEGIGLDANGDYAGGQFFLKSHANEGIISAQYEIGDLRVYELNVGWHHGESGGPIVTLTDPPSAFAIMQHYRNIKSPHGVVAGPHRGIALSAIAKDLLTLGVLPFARAA